jgi:Uma2 family endonuclease
MSTVIIELPPHQAQTEFNLRRWAEVLADPDLAKVPGRVETDRYGKIVMSPPPAPNHGNLLAEIVYLLRQLLPRGRTISECPISTADGVKGADVAWASIERWRELAGGTCFTRAPEICVEVLSPRNSEAEIREKTALYFDAGAREVWVCGTFGAMSFFAPGGVELDRSGLCPKFPKQDWQAGLSVLKDFVEARRGFIQVDCLHSKTLPLGAGIVQARSEHRNRLLTKETRTGFVPVGSML